jgi:hypothetical protein
MKEDVLETMAATTSDNTSEVTKHKGLEFRRYFTREGISPFDSVQWEYRTAAITGEGGEVIFEQKDVEVPRTWSMTATNIVASKYFHGTLGTPDRETSVRQLIGRVATQITKWGGEGGYFASDQDAAIFHDELVYLLVNQNMAFNSPVWFNCGVEVKPQVGFGNGEQSLSDPIFEGAALGRRHRLRPGIFHEGIRCVCRRYQIRRQDTPRGKDGHPECWTSGHCGVHQFQGKRGKEGLGSAR